MCHFAFQHPSWQLNKWSSKRVTETELKKIPFKHNELACPGAPYTLTPSLYSDKVLKRSLSDSSNFQSASVLVLLLKWKEPELNCTWGCKLSAGDTTRLMATSGLLLWIAVLQVRCRRTGVLQWEPTQKWIIRYCFHPYTEMFTKHYLVKLLKFWSEYEQQWNLLLNPKIYLSSKPFFSVCIHTSN